MSSLQINSKKPSSRIPSRASSLPATARPSPALGTTETISVPLKRCASTRTVGSKDTAYKTVLATVADKTITEQPFTSKVKLPEMATGTFPIAKRPVLNIKSIKPLVQIQKDDCVRRAEILRKLGEKLAKTREKSGVERTTKTGKGAAPKSAKASSAAGGSVHGGFNTLSMSKVESHLRTHTWQFVDLIINCMVIDTYIFGILVVLASLASIVIAWMKLTECSVQPLLPYFLITNAVLNIIQAHLRNLANQKLVDFFVMSFFRFFAFISFVLLFATVLTVDPSVTIWYLPKDAYYVSVSPITYCSTLLYYYSLYFCYIGSGLCLLLSLYTVGCVTYMVATGSTKLASSAITDTSVAPSQACKASKAK